MRSKLSPSELKFCELIALKEADLRSVLLNGSLEDPVEPRQWLKHLTSIKHSLGNLNNDLSFIASLLAKEFLLQRLGVRNFDAAKKPQGAAGIDVEANTPDGKLVVGEIKTTRPYQEQNGFGAAQRAAMLKDLARLAASKADFRFMFVVDDYAFKSLCTKAYSSKAIGVELVNLVSGETQILGGD